MAGVLPQEELGVIRQYKRKVQQQPAAPPPSQPATPSQPAQTPSTGSTPVNNRGLQGIPQEGNLQPKTQLGYVGTNTDGTPRFDSQLAAFQKQLQQQGWSFQLGSDGYWHAYKVITVNGKPFRVEARLVAQYKKCPNGGVRKVWVLKPTGASFIGQVNIPENLQPLVARVKQLKAQGHSWQVASFEVAKEYYQQHFGEIKTKQDYRNVENMAAVISQLAENNPGAEGAGLQLSNLLSGYGAQKKKSLEEWENYQLAFNTAEGGRALKLVDSYYASPRIVNGRTPTDEFLVNFASGASWGLSEFVAPSSGGALDAVAAQLPGGYSYYNHAPLTPMRVEDQQVFLARTEKLFSENPGLEYRVLGAVSGRIAGDLFGFLVTPEIVGAAADRLGVTEFLRSKISAGLSKLKLPELKFTGVKLDVGAGDEALADFNSLHGYKTETWQYRLRAAKAANPSPAEAFEKAGLTEYADFIRGLEKNPPEKGSDLWLLYDAIKSKVEGGANLNDILYERLNGKYIKNWLDDLINPKETFQGGGLENLELRGAGGKSGSGADFDVESGGGNGVLKLKPPEEPPKPTGANIEVNAGGGGLKLLLKPLGQLDHMGFRALGALNILRPANNAGALNFTGVKPAPRQLNIPRAGSLRINVPGAAGINIPRYSPRTENITRDVVREDERSVHVSPPRPGKGNKTRTIPHSRGKKGQKGKGGLPPAPPRLNGPGSGGWPENSYKLTKKWRVRWFG